MSTSGEYYATRLYPFQDGILAIVRESETPLYLTGGTALSRRWFGHRYSDDLDLFTNDDPAFSRHVERVLGLLQEAERNGKLRVDKDRLVRTDAYVQLWLQQVGGVELKVDLVNDVAPYLGEIEVDAVLGRTDNCRNILANKISALFRYEPKDMADLWVIARHMSFSWRDAVSDAQQKEAGLDPVDLHEIIRSVPEDELKRVHWASPVDLGEVRADLAVIAEDILQGAANSLRPTA
jgi:hypothetical protein